MLVIVIVIFRFVSVWRWLVLLFEKCCCVDFDVLYMLLYRSVLWKIFKIVICVKYVLCCLVVVVGVWLILV